MNFCQNRFVIVVTMVLWIRILAVVGLRAVADLPAFVCLFAVDGFPTFESVPALCDDVSIFAAILLLLLKSLLLLTSFRIWLPTFVRVLTVSRGQIVVGVPVIAGVNAVGNVPDVAHFSAVSVVLAAAAVVTAVTCVPF